ncbi:MAG: MFS transporter, partial [Chloroflexi bacterium CFX7]|nr:MFS transporter [Chloroflexi bacterium CFX7]
MTGPGVLQPLGETLTQRQKMLVVGALMISMFVGAIDQTVVSTAMPRIVAELGGFGLLSWVFTSYMLSSTVVVPLVGKLSDTFGRKWFILGGIAVFQIGSLACGAAPNIESLIAFRALQGIGGGAI